MCLYRVEGLSINNSRGRRETVVIRVLLTGFQMKFCVERLENRELLAANLVADINQLTSQSSHPRDFVNVGEQAFFVADSEFGTELWKSDGTADGTQLVRDIEPGEAGSFPTNLTPLEDLLLFHVNGDVWRSDGTEEGTFELLPNTRLLVASQRFAITDDAHVTDGTADGTLAIDGDLRTPVSIDVEGAAATNDWLFLQLSSNRLFQIDLRILF